MTAPVTGSPPPEPAGAPGAPRSAGGGRSSRRSRSSSSSSSSSSPSRGRFLPPALLVSAVVLAAWFSHQRGGLHRTREADAFTINALALASNLSAEHGYLGFYYRFRDADGEVRYEPHNRFPPGGLFLLKAVIAPFGDDLSAQVRAARLLMFAFFAGLAVVAYLALSRLTGRRWLAFAATLLALSSWYWNYIDMVGTELAPDLFAVFLTFHGMVLFVREGRFAQLLVKTGAALLVGWHVYALLAPFLLLGWAALWFREGRRLRGEGAPTGSGRALRRRAVLLLRSRYSILAAASLVVGGGVLAWNFGSEYAAFDGEVAFRDLPSVQSMAYRTGRSAVFSEANANLVEWAPFLEGQGHRLGRMAVPFALPGYASALDNYGGEVVEHEGLLLAALVLGVSFFGLRLLPDRRLFAGLALSGFFWAIPMRYNTAFHDVEALYYLGSALVFYTVLLTAFSRAFGAGSVPTAAALATLVFGFSHYRIAAEAYDPEQAAYWRRVEADFSAIRPLTAGAPVSYPEFRFRDTPLGGMNIVPWFLSGRVLVRRDERRADGDFVLSRQRLPGPALLTPDNREVFLYDPEAFEGDLFRALRSGAAPAGSGRDRGDRTP